MTPAISPLEPVETSLSNAQLAGHLRILVEEEEMFLGSQEEIDFFHPTLPSQKTENPLPPPPFPPKEVQKETASVAKEAPPPIPKTTPPSSTTFSPAPSFLKELFRKSVPHIPILDAPPDDTRAKNLKNAWKALSQASPISILLLGEPKEHQELLQAIGETLDVYFQGAKTVQAQPLEEKNQWNSFLDSPSLRWILMCDASLRQLPNLRAFYREIPSQQARYVKQIPLFLLPDLSLYLKDPALKKSLWMHLYQSSKTMLHL